MVGYIYGLFRTTKEFNRIGMAIHITIQSKSRYTHSIINTYNTVNIPVVYVYLITIYCHRKACIGSSEHQYTT